MKNSIPFLVLLLFPLPAKAAEFTGRVVGVADGDTATILSGRTRYKVRLAEIDAPEKRQAFGMAAKKALSAKIFGQTVRVVWTVRDRYGRTVGTIYLGERWINREMVAEGWAWHYRAYSKSQNLADAERAARVKRLGLWADDHPTPPWEFRRRKRK